MRLDRDKFYKGFRPYFKEIANRPITPTQVANLETFLDSVETSAWLGQDVRRVAYAIATIHIETFLPKSNSRYAPITEGGGRSYFNRYDIKGNPRKARELGNVNPGDGYLFRGRGYCQLTGRNNYEKFGIADSPDDALDPKIAFHIFETGMRTGLFSGRKLGDYITPNGTDYKGARHVINGQDRAAEIAGYARNIEHFLRDAQLSMAASSEGKAADPLAAESATDLPTGGSTNSNEQPSTSEEIAPPASLTDTPKPSIWERMTGWKTKLDTASSLKDSLNPFTPSVSPISGTSGLSVVTTKAGGWGMLIEGFLKDNWIYMAAGVVMIIAALTYLAIAKHNAAKRSAPVVEAPVQQTNVEVKTT